MVKYYVNVLAIIGTLFFGLAAYYQGEINEEVLITDNTAFSAQTLKTNRVVMGSEARIIVAPGVALVMQGITIESFDFNQFDLQGDGSALIFDDAIIVFKNQPALRSFDTAVFTVPMHWTLGFRNAVTLVDGPIALNFEHAEQLVQEDGATITLQGDIDIRAAQFVREQSHDGFLKRLGQKFKRFDVIASCIVVSMALFFLTSSHYQSA